MLERIPKSKNESDHPGLRKRPKTVENWTKSNIVIFLQFWGVFSAQDDRTNFSSFALHQASQDTSLEYPQRVLCKNFLFTLNPIRYGFPDHPGLRKRPKTSEK